MTSEIAIYYYLKRMDEDLQDELKSKLEGYINLDSRSANLNAPLSSNPKVAIIHGGQRNNADLRNQINNINFNLIILLSQGGGRPKEATDKYQSEFDGTLIWDCGTEYLIQHFERLEKQLTGNPNNWQLENWLSTELNQLSALALLCQAYLAIDAGGEEWSESKTGDISNPKEFLDRSMIQQVTKNLTGKKVRVCEASWWLDGLALWDEENQIINWQKWEKFERDIAQEWESQSNEQIPDAIGQLLNAIKQTPTRLKQPQIVAEAYESVVICLGAMLIPNASD